VKTMFDLSKVSKEIQNQINSSDKYREMFSKKPEKLLAIDTNAKTVKGQKKGYMTAIMYLSPASISGNNTCPMAVIAQCDKPCLNTAGRGAMSNVSLSRLRKTLYFQQYTNEFLAQLIAEIHAAIKHIEKKGFIPVFRLNGTSDIRWEKYGIPQLFPNVQFYDYTKLVNRRDIPSNYDITFSYSGVKEFLPFVSKAMDMGMRIATVFRSKNVVSNMLNNNSLIMGKNIVDGDETDLRFLEPKNVIVALYAKGKAKHDQSGFVYG
jgi:hypothetical protein